MHLTMNSTERVSRRRILALAGGTVGAAVVLATGGRPGSAQAGEPSFSPETRAALDRIVDTRLAADGIPGVAAGVWIPGRGTWVRAAGTSDTATGTPLRREDRFRIASVTKTFVATVLLQLVDEGRLTLDDRLEQFIPGIPNGDRITLRQLLGMTAGIFNWIEAPAFREAYERDPLLPFGPDEVVAILRRQPPDFPPGERAQYSDSNYVLLGLIIEEATGRPISEVIAERVTRPLGLTHTSFPTTAAMPSPYTHGYAATVDGVGVRDVTRSNPAIPWAAGAMISNLDDLRIWAKALATGALLSPAAQRDRLDWTPLGGEGAYGLGINDVFGLIGHTGGILGYSTFVFYLPEEDATIVLLANRSETQSSPATGIFLDIVRLLFPGRLPPPQ